MPDDANRLFDSAVDQVRRGQVRPALLTLIEVLRHEPTHRDALSSAARICRILGSEPDARLFERVAEAPEDVPALYDLGFRLVDQGCPQAAVSLLERALAEAPEEAAVRRELAYARLASGDFTGCLRALAPLADEPALSETERLDVLLTQAEAALLARKRDLSAAILAQAEEIVPDDSQRERLDALAQQVGRAARFPTLDSLGLREWHFIQHAGVILKTAGGYFEDGSRAGRFDVVELRPDMVAFLLQRLAHLLERLGLVPDAVAATGETAAPLAHALARRLGAAVLDDPDDAAAGSTLLVAVNAQEFAAHAARVARHVPELRLFSVFLDWEREAPVCPEVVGVLARRVFLPWERRFGMPPGGGPAQELPADPRRPDEIGAELAALIEALPDDGGAARLEFESAYMPLASALVLGHEEVHPSRRRFTPLSPCWTPLSPRPPAADRGGARWSGPADPDEPPDEPPDDPRLG